MTKVQEYMLNALKEAIRMEVDGRQFYLEAAKKTKNEGIRQILDYLAESELYHIDKFKEIYQSFQKDPTWTEELAEFKPPHVEPYACVLAMNQVEVGAAEKEELEPLVTGLQMEQCSIDYYTKLAKETNIPLARRFFMSLAHEERGHYLMLLDMHNYLTDPADWFYVTEKSMVDGA
jgi:rubrerythrin